MEQENGSKCETDCFEKRGGEQCCGGSIVLDERWFSLFFFLMNVNSISITNLMIWGIIVQNTSSEQKRRSKVWRMGALRLERLGMVNFLLLLWTARER